MIIQKEYEGSVRRLKDSVTRMEQLGYVVPHSVVSVQEQIAPPAQVRSKKYLMVLMLFSLTCEHLGYDLTSREQIVVKLTLLRRKHLTPELKRRYEKLDGMVASFDRNIENQRRLLEYRASILLDLLAGKTPISRY